VEVTIHICMVFGYDILCDLLEMLNFNKYRSAVTTRSNLVVDRNEVHVRIYGHSPLPFRASRRDARYTCTLPPSGWMRVRYTLVTDGIGNSLTMQARAMGMNNNCMQ
jgi:hypothetical protein